MRAYKTILAGIDLSPRDELPRAAAIEAARYLHAERIHLVNVATPFPSWIADPTNGSAAAFESVFQAGVEAANAALEALPMPPDLQVTREVRVGGIAEELTHAAEQVNADLVIAGSHPRGRIGTFVLGSIAGALVRAAPCPVLVVGPDRPLRAPIRNALAAIDGSSISAEVVEHCAAFAQPGEGRVRVLSCFDLHRALKDFAPLRGLAVDRMIEACEARYRAEMQAIVERAGVKTFVDVRAHHDPKQLIMELAEALRPDLVAIGTSGHNAWERLFLGSTAARILSEAPCPVLVVPQRRSVSR